MLASVLGVALGAHLLLGLDPAMALLTGAVLAPLALRRQRPAHPKTGRPAR